MLHPLQHLQFIVHHLLIALDILLEDDLDRVLLAFTLCLSDNAICSCTKSLAKPVLVPSLRISACSWRALNHPTSCRSCQAGLEYD